MLVRPVFSSVYLRATQRLSVCTEVAFVGKAPGQYQMLLGGGYYGQRMNKIYRGTSIYSAIENKL